MLAFVRLTPFAAVLSLLAVAFAAPAGASPPVITQGSVTSGGAISLQSNQLRFSSVISVGSAGGSLTLSGARVDTTVSTMDGYQTVDGVKKLVGALQYNYDVTHQHWHYLSLDRYDLRPHDPSQIDVQVARDQKTGFCLVDNSGQISNPTDCEKNQPGALGVSEAIPHGGSDIYAGGVDGQFIDMTNVASGTYELVQWVNADCRLTDSGPAGHTAAVVIDYDKTHGTVSVDNATPYWNAYYAALPSASKCLPTESQRPQVSGTAEVGEILSSAPGGWLERMTTSFSYQWRRCDSTGWACVDIPAATSANYAPTAADVGHTLRARVTALDAATMEQASPQDSEATAAVAPPPPPSPTPTGGPPGPPSPTPSSTAPAASGPTPSSGALPAGPIRSLVVALRSRHRVSTHSLIALGLPVRVHCSMQCRIRVDLKGAGSVPLAHGSSELARAESRRLILRLRSKARRVLSHYRSGTLTLWLHVTSSDGQRQTVAYVLSLRP